MSYNKKQTEQYDLENQEWRPFPNYSQTRGRYFVSNFGRYKSQWKNGKFYYSLGAKKCGYYSVTVYSGGKKVAQPYMQDVVAEAFYGPISADEVVHHKNQNKHDNNLSNLKIEKKSQHSTHHNLGKKLKQQTKRKIGLANAPRKDPKTGRFRKMKKRGKK